MKNKFIYIWMLDTRRISLVGILYQYSKIAYLQVDSRCYYARKKFTLTGILRRINSTWLPVGHGCVALCPVAPTILQAYVQLDHFGAARTRYRSGFNGLYNLIAR